MEDLQNNEEGEMVVETSETAGANPKKVFMKGIVSAVVALVVLGGAGSVFAAYRAPDSVPAFIPNFLAAVHAPAATIDGKMITWFDVKTDSDALTKYVASASANGGVPNPDNYKGDGLRLRVLHRLLLTAAAEKFAADHGVTVTTAELDKQLADIATQSGGEDKIKADIQSNFGWTYEQYRDRVVRSMVLFQKLQDSFLADDSFTGPTRVKAEAALSEVKDGKKDFATIAKEQSEDSSASNGGDLGQITRGMTVKPFEDAVFSMKKGQVSDLVKTQFGYHIINVLDIKDDKTGKPESVHARHILFKFPSVVQKVQDYLKTASVHQFVHTSAPAVDDIQS
ncbi:MAG: peptidylprolyl isomerase [Candidatus Magasanikbacteria bacterium]|nr:peptidylprolyl isomerase [Candidatus Magasanikbacteria bacterium]